MQNRVLLMLVCLLFAGFSLAQKKAKEAPDPAAEINKPRADARKVTFEVDEGTWMSVDLSPDGTTILFDLLGDIYSIPASGGEAKRLTSGPAWDVHPRYSPDGKKIAFGSDRSGIENVWIMNADGSSPVALTSEKDHYVRSAVWSPDGTYLAARKETGTRAGIPPVELWLYNVHGGSGIQLTSSDTLNNASGPVFSRDDRYIYYSARQQNFSYVPNVSNGLFQIVRYDRRTGESTPLTSGYGGAVRPLLSPDGNTMIFVSRREERSILVSRDLRSGAEKILLDDVTRDEQEGFTQMDLWPNYAFAPDGRSIVFFNKGRIERLDLASGTTQRIPFTAKVEQHLAPLVAWQEKVETGPVTARILRWPTLSPDARSIVFDALGRIWVQALTEGKASGAPRRLTADASSLPPREYSPSISPDGQWVAYVTWSDAEGGHVWKAPLAGTGAPQKLTRTAGHYANPEWSPRGDRLAIVQGSGLEFRGRQPEEESHFEIRVLSAGGGEPELVTTVPTGNTFRFHPQASWSADGTRLYFADPIQPKTPKDDPKNDLVSIRLDGTDKRHHLRFPAGGDFVPSPDERWVVFTSRDNVYVTPLPRIALAQPPEVALKDGAVPVWRLSRAAGGYVGWADAGRTITWGLANQFHRLPIEAAVKFAEEQRRKAEKKEGDSEAKSEASADKAEDDLAIPASQVTTIALTAPRSIPKGSVVFRNARIVTMKGDEVIERADLLVTDNRIASIGTPGAVSVPSGTKEIDAAGKTIIPGLIDAHAHMHYSSFELFPETKWEYAANLAYGVTTVYDPSAPSLDVFAQAEMVETGAMIGPRVYSSGDVLYGGQHTDIFAEVNSLKDARRQVDRMKAYGARMIKVYQQPRRAQRIWFAEAARQARMLLTAEGAGELHTDITMAMDGYTAFEHSLPVKLQEDVVQLVAKSGTHYTPTLLVSYGGPWGEQYFWQTRNPHDDPKLNRFTPHLTIDPKARRFPWIHPDEYFFPTVATGAAEVLRAGGRVSLGAHGQMQGIGVHWELWAMAGEGGEPGSAMTPMESLRAATILAAEKLGFAPDLGSIEKGKLADFIVLDSNPLDDIHNTAAIRWVVKNGEVYEGETLNAVWPQERPLPRFFWASE